MIRSEMPAPIVTPAEFDARLIAALVDTTPNAAVHMAAVLSLQVAPLWFTTNADGVTASCSACTADVLMADRWDHGQSHLEVLD